jgi:hypothetical protein
MVWIANVREQRLEHGAPAMDGLVDLLEEEPILIAPAVGHSPASRLVAFIRVESNLLLIRCP